MSSLIHTPVPIFSPTVPRYHKSLDPSSSHRTQHVRQCYDVYRVCLGRGDIPRAKRAWALLMREGSLDWATNWREAYRMVSLRASFDEDASANIVTPSPDHYGTLESRILRAEQARLQREREQQKALVDLQISFLRQVHSVHSRPAKKKQMKKSLREPVQVLEELVLLMANKGRDAEALAELELSLATYPYRDSQELHYYAGLLSVRIAQKQLLDDFPAMVVIPPSAAPGSVQATVADKRNKRRRSSSSVSTDSGSSSSSSSSSSQNRGLAQAAPVSEADDNNAQILAILARVSQDTAGGAYILSNARTMLQRVLDIREGASASSIAMQKMRESTASLASADAGTAMSRLEKDAVRWLHMLDGNDPLPSAVPVYAVPPAKVGPRGGQLYPESKQSRSRRTSRASSAASTGPSAASIVESEQTQAADGAIVTMNWNDTGSESDI